MPAGVDLVLLLEPMERLIVLGRDRLGASRLRLAVVVKGLARVVGETKERDVAADL